MDSSPKGWYSRGYLPHFDDPGRIQAITFRLADSLPQATLRDIESELELIDKAISNGLEPVRQFTIRAAKQRMLIEKYLDAGMGACHLRDPFIEKVVEDALRHFDGVRYRLLAWCVMPNHVHILVETKTGFSLPKLVQSWKSFTAREANAFLERVGAFWQRDYFDRFIRDDAHLVRTMDYIEQNPVKAGLVLEVKSWQFSSARFR